MNRVAVSDDKWTELVTAGDVTEEVLKAAFETAEDWYPGNERIDWDRLFDKLDGYQLSDGTLLTATGFEAIEKIKRYVRQQRRANPA